MVQGVGSGAWMARRSAKSAGGPPPMPADGGRGRRGVGGWLRRRIDAVVTAVVRLVVAVAVLLIAGGAWIGVVIGAATWEKLQEIPEDSAALMDGRQRGSVTVLDRAGEKLGVRGQRLERITVDDASRPLLDAVLSAEDRRFYWHLGLDPIGLVRALAVNYRLGYTAQGGSTITQQVAKLAFLNQERTLSRKLHEVPYALALELAYSKDEILSIYLNRAYLGAASFGFEAASRRYFGKSAREVRVSEAALLAGLLRAPSRWSPEADFAGAQERAGVILGAMADARVLRPEEYAAARDEVRAMSLQTPDEFSPHFVDWIADERVEALLAGLDPETLGGAPEEIDVVVSTTLDRAAQSAAEEAIAKTFEDHPQTKDNQDAEAAAVILDSQSAAVRAMVGGRTYGDSVFNRAVAGNRQVGSAFKPIVYATALENGLRPNASVKDAPVRIGRWSPKNYSGRYLGWMTLETALSRSSNTAAVRLMSRVGPRRIVETAERFGYPQGVTPYPSIALGAIEASPLQVAGAYAVFPRGGRKTEPYAVEEIRRPGGEVLWTRPAPETDPDVGRVIRPATAGYLTTMMRSVVERGTGRRARLPDYRPVAGKTGTTQSARDVWFAAFTADYVGVFWVGKDDNVALRGKVVGGNLPADIWREAMEPLHDGLALAALPDRPIPGAVRHATVAELEAAALARAEAEKAALAEGATEDAAKAAGAAAAARAAPSIYAARAHAPAAAPSRAAAAPSGRFWPARPVAPPRRAAPAASSYRARREARRAERGEERSIRKRRLYD